MGGVNRLSTDVHSDELEREKKVSGQANVSSNKIILSLSFLSFCYRFLSPFAFAHENIVIGVTDVVVKWSPFSPSTPTTRVRILLK